MGCMLCQSLTRTQPYQFMSSKRDQAAQTKCCVKKSGPLHQIFKGGVAHPLASALISTLWISVLLMQVGKTWNLLCWRNCFFYKFNQKGHESRVPNRYDQATQNSAPLVTLLNLGGPHCLYLSVFEPKVAQHSKTGRVFVTYNVRGKLGHCGCFRGRKRCLHKCQEVSLSYQERVIFPWCQTRGTTQHCWIDRRLTCWNHHVKVTWNRVSTRRRWTETNDKLHLQ